MLTGLSYYSPGGVIFQIVDRCVLLVESTINYNNLPFFIEVKFNT
jgi:hypothetical protein